MKILRTHKGGTLHGSHWDIGTYSSDYDETLDPRIKLNIDNAHLGLTLGVWGKPEEFRALANEILRHCDAADAAISGENVA